VYYVTCILIHKLLFLGDSWLIVEPPFDLKLSQISVGSNSIWAVTSDKHVWFRKGIKGEVGSDNESAIGTGWVEMIGEMTMVSVAPNDQVIFFPIVFTNHYTI
jgi:tectonin beta-propeller repeat-containing protein 1